MKRKTVQIENVIHFKKKRVAKYILNLRTGVCYRIHISQDLDCDSWKIMIDQQKHFPNKDIYKEGDKLGIVEDFEMIVTTSRELN